jgi:flagellar biosynthesis regulator FlaF
MSGSFNNLLCANKDYLEDNNFSKFTTGIATYDKLLNTYTQNNCSSTSNNNNQFTIKLIGSDYISGSGGNINTTCKDLRSNLVAIGLTIDNASKKYTQKLQDDLIPYNIKKNTLISTYNNLIEKRFQLDQDAQKVIGQENTPLYEKQEILDSAVFTTLLWTVLATSVIYYTFTKL